MHASALFVSLLATTSAAYSQLGAYGLVNTSIGHEFSGLTLADLDQDGRLDVLTTSTGDDRIVLYRSVGGGEFDAGVEVSRLATNLGAARVGDVDGDGVLDIVFPSGPFVVLMRGLGALRYAAPVTIATANNVVVELWLRDLDLDGDLDLVFWTPLSLFVAFGTGTGGFLPTQTLWSTTSSRTFSAASIEDLDGDGLVEVMVALPQNTMIQGSVFTFVQSSPGTFAALPAATPGPYPFRGLWPFDADLDGDFDLLHHDPATARLLWLRNDGSGPFVPVAAPLGLFDGLRDLVRVDLDGDGDQDLVFGASGSAVADRRIGELSLTGPATLVANGNQVQGVTLQPVEIAVADVDGDGLLDLAHVAETGRLVLHARLPGGGYGPARELTERVPGAFNGAFTVADLDGDGGTEVVAMRDRQVLLFHRSASGTFGREVLGPMPPRLDQLPDLADLDGDGDLDLVYPTVSPVPGSYDVRWAARESAGFGVERTLGTYPGGIEQLQAVTLDWDQDGDPDVLVSSFVLGEQRVFMNLGGGSFAPSAVVGTTPNAVVLPPADVDGDGREDLVLAGPLGVQVRRNLGSAQFAAAVVVVGPAPFSDAITFADLDQDGDLELLRHEPVGSVSAVGPLRLYRNLGGLAFDAGTSVVSGSWLTLRVADYDLDGQADLVLLRQVERRVSWLRQSAPTVFGPEVLLTDTLDFSDTLQLVDLDGDSDLDLMLHDEGWSALRTFENLRSIGQDTCPGQPNSTGMGAALTVAGSNVVGVNQTSLVATRLPANTVGYFLSSRTAAPTPVPGLGQGLLCLAAPIGRHNRPGEVLTSSPTGRFVLSLELTDIPTPTGSVAALAGETWHFQAWYRDATPTPTSNLTSAVQVMFR